MITQNFSGCFCLIKTVILNDLINYDFRDPQSFVSEGSHLLCWPVTLSVFAWFPKLLVDSINSSTYSWGLLSSGAWRRVSW